ncbi:short-chain alcohol dehydrogenase [Marasmius sp. AFHP31]|nr:short-chain alcohol dehydrogenase [Marasmius sp. AFHP31]
MPANSFTESDIPDLTGKVALVTGGNSGIGKQIVSVLAAKGAKVYLAARSEEKYEKALQEIHRLKPDNPGQIAFLKLDLSTAQRAKEAADDFKRKETALHLLFNNAGIMGMENGVLSDDGYELRWATNVFGPFVFTYHLLPLLLQTSKSFPPGTVRIINIASDSPKRLPKTGGIPLDDPTVGQNGAAMECYSYSKLASILITRQLAKRHPGIWSFAPHPGTIGTEFMTKIGIPGPLLWVLNRTMFKTVQYGALTPLYAGTSPTIDATQNGKFLMPVAKFEDRLPHPQAGDDEFGATLWEWNMTAMKRAGAD